ncbi:MAG: DUF2272 domain-containing protein [Chitinophagales bacterium]|nr:DUF2272 domain-containing protein [Chitinophagales bacterium]
MKRNLLFTYLFIGLFSFAQENNNSISLVSSNSQFSIHNTSNELEQYKSNLLNIIQQEYNFWNHPINRTERDLSAVEKIKSYWSSLNFFPSTKQIKSFYWQEAHPWSAVFISWCMKKAGYESCFLYSINHAKYILWANDNKINQQYKNPFWAYNINDKEAAYPASGDLLCKNREGKEFSLNTIHKKSISHCDIVFEVDKANGIVVTIGGNVADKVNKRWVFLDENGFIDTNAAWLYYDKDNIPITGSQSEFFSVIKVQ